MANEYHLATGPLLWKPESVPYDAEVTIDNYLGLISEDVELPHPNELTAKGSLGHTRQPYVYASGENEYEFTLPVEVLDARIPLECAIGRRIKYNMQIGYQTINNSEKDFTGAETIVNGTYHLDVTEDGGGLNDVSVVCVGDTITTMLVKLQTALRILTGGSETCEVEYGMIKIASGTLGAASSIIVADGVGDDGGLVAALTAISGVTAITGAATRRDGIAAASFEYIFDDEDKLSTITVYGANKGLGIEMIYAGCKGSLGIACAVGEPLKADFSIMGTHYDFNTGVSHFQSPSVALPSLEPYRFWMVSDAILNFAGVGAFKDLVAIKAVDLSWDNGLANKMTRGNVRDAVWAREGYVLTEDSGPDRYDMKLEIYIDDVLELQESYDNDTLFDFYIKWQRVHGDDTETVEAWLYSCKIGGLPVGLKTSGPLEGTITLYPLDTRIRIVTAAEITV